VLIPALTAIDTDAFFRVLLNLPIQPRYSIHSSSQPTLKMGFKESLSLSLPPPHTQRAH
jgi:hypothetical protein